MAKYRIGVDIGGTFSDFVVFCEDTQKVDILKIPSTPADPSQAIITGLKQLTEDGVPPGEVAFFSHGTTVGTNALLELKGVQAGLMVTEGFRGIYEVMDQTRGHGPNIYNLFFQRPALLATARCTEEVPERIDYKGDVLVPLDEEAARRSVRRLRDKGVQSIAVCLLFSFMNPRHEQRLKEIIHEEYPSCSVSLSCEVLPQIREHYRLSTTMINAYISPILSRYLERMEAGLRGQGITTSQLYVMQSNGGVTAFHAAAARAVTTVLSGPAAGVIAGASIGQVAGFPNVITLDMGGTSCDIALMESGVPIQTTQGRIGDRHLSVPILDINTISAGGGTIAWLDNVGVLQVGPRSAGTCPGPVCYDQGGTQPTITDANVVLGFIDPNYFLGGKMQLNKLEAERAIDETIARPLDLSVMAAADGILKIINTDMEQGIKAVSSERGYDLRDYALVPFGGAGPIHAGRLAAELGIPWVLVPPIPGVTSAMGLLMCDVRHDYVQSKLKQLSQVTPEEANTVFAQLGRNAISEMLDEGFHEANLQLLYFLDMRYSGQGYELTIPAVGGATSAEDLKAVGARFHDYHFKLHGHKAEDEPVEIVNYRVVALATVSKVSLKEHGGAENRAETARKGSRQVYFTEYGRVADCPIYERGRLTPGDRLAGPAVVEQRDSTVVIYPGQTARVDAYLNILISTRGEA